MGRPTKHFAEENVNGAVIRIGWLNENARVDKERALTGGKAALYAYAPSVTPRGKISYGKQRQLLYTVAGSKVMAFGPGDAEAIDTARSIVQQVFGSQLGSVVRNPCDVTMTEAMDARLQHLSLGETVRATYKSSCKQFTVYMRLAGKPKLTVLELDSGMVDGFMRWLTHDRGIKITTAKQYAAYVVSAWKLAQEPTETREMGRDRIYKKIQLCKPTGTTVKSPSRSIGKLAKKLGVTYERTSKNIGSAATWAKILDAVNLDNEREVSVMRAIIIGLFTGLRPEHIAQIDWSKFDRHVGQFGYAAIDTKEAAHGMYHADNKGRPDIRIAAGLLRHLDEWQAEFVYHDVTKPEDARERRQAINCRTSRTMKDLCERAGLTGDERVTMSSTRHTVYTLIADLPGYKRWMGHDQSAIDTVHYLKRSDDWYAEIIAKIDGFIAEINSRTTRIYAV